MFYYTWFLKNFKYRSVVIGELEYILYSNYVICFFCRVLKLKEVKNNTDQMEIAEDFTIVANRENCVSLMSEITMYDFEQYMGVWYM